MYFLAQKLIIIAVSEMASCEGIKPWDKKKEKKGKKMYYLKNRDSNNSKVVFDNFLLFF